MDIQELAYAIRAKIQKRPYEYQAYEDYYGLMLERMNGGHSAGIDGLRWLAGEIEANVSTMARVDIEAGRKLVDLDKRVLLALAPHDFDSYLLYVEWNRAPEKQFYRPRRMRLGEVAKAMQALEDDELDLLAISLPPGVGKTTLAIFYLTWLAGKYPDSPILTASHSNSFVRGAYDECLRIMDVNGEYLWHDVFPGVQVSNTNAKDCRIDLGKRKRFETLQFTSIGTGNAGLYRAMQLLYCDDLVSGKEVALSKERLDKLWGIYGTDLRQRKIGNRCKELHIATRWSLYDVIGNLEEHFGDGAKAKFINISAEDENGESQFNYPYWLGYSTEDLRKLREVMDDADYRALFLGQPIEREGLLYHPDELRRYFELPDGEPDAIIAVCDTKTKGVDYCVMPIAYQYGADFYIDGVICDNGNPDAVEPRLASMLTERRVQLARFESNQAGGKIAEKIQGMVKELGGRAKLTTKYTTANKETRIIVASPYAKEHFLFKDDSVIKQDKEYRRFLQFLCGYTMAGRNKHDDVPDAVSMLVEYIQSFSMNKVEIIRRPF